MRRIKIGAAIVVCALVLGTRVPADAAVNRCTGAKLTATGKNLSAAARCNSKTISKGLTAADSATCEARPDSTLPTAFTKAGLLVMGGCMGSASATAADLEVCESTMATLAGQNDAAPHQSICDSRKITAMGKYTSSTLTCLSKQAAHGTDPTSCESKAALAFSNAIGRLATASDCTNANSVAAMEASIGSNCLLPLQNEIFPPPCTATDFTFNVNSSGGGVFSDSSWPGGTATQGTAHCGVTVNQPSGDVVLVGALGNSWTISSFTSGFSSCILTGGCNAHGGTCTSCDGVDAPSSCPPLGISNCTNNRPSCSTGLNGDASDTAHVHCVP